MKRLNRSVKGLIVAGIFIMGIHLAGCGGTKQAAVPNYDDQPWEVRVETDLDTLIYTEGQNPARTTAGETEDAGLVTTSDYDPDPPEGWEDPSPVMETPVVTESRPAAYAEAVPVLHNRQKFAEPLHKPLPNLLLSSVRPPGA